MDEFEAINILLDTPPEKIGKDLAFAIAMGMAVSALKKQAAINKRNWENGFQRWSNKQQEDGTTSLGKCGYGSMCDYCTDNSYGRPCVRALNAACKEEQIRIDYRNKNYDEIWRSLNNGL